MEQKHFIDKLSEFAEVTQEKVPASAARREIKEPVEVWRDGQPMIIEYKKNPTLAVKLKKLKVKPKPCEDCGLKVDNRVVNHRLHTFPKSHWRTSCENCRMVKNPETGKFDVEFERGQAAFVTYFRNNDK